MTAANLMALTEHALREHAAAGQTLPNGHHLMIYPVESGILVALGYKAESVRRDKLAATLRRRASNVARFGKWMPALMADGAFYVVRRIEQDGLQDGLPILSPDEMLVGEELIS